MSNPLGDLSNDVVRAPRGSVLMHQGEIGKCAYFVVQGRLIVEREEHGRKIKIAEIGARDLVGELAILDDHPRSATVTVAEDSLLILLNKHRIRSIIRRSPNIAELILKILSQKLRNTHQLFAKGVDITNPHVWIRICTLLSLTSKSSPDPQKRYTEFESNLKLILDIPDAMLNEIFGRLQNARMMESSGGMISTVSQEYIEAFLYYAEEEFVDEPFPEPTEIMEYQAIQWLSQQCRSENPSIRKFAYPKQNILGLLVYSPLWKKLHPTFQQQRAESMLEHLIKNTMLEVDPNHPEQAIIDLDMLAAFPQPKDEIAAYSSIKNSLLRE